MKRFLILLLTLFFFTSCTSNEGTPDAETKEEVEQEEEKVEELQDEEDKKEEELQEDTEEVEVETDSKTDQGVEWMDTDQMIEESDAIAKVKYFHKNGEKHYKILETFRGNFNESFEKPTIDLMENRPYLFFYKEENGQLVPTNGEDSYLLLEGDMHEIFEKIKQ